MRPPVVSVASILSVSKDGGVGITGVRAKVPRLFGGGDIKQTQVKGVFLRTHLFLRNLPGSPHTSSHMSGHHLATVRRAGRKRGARFESSEALAEQPAVRRSAVELHGCCARVSLAEALLNQHIDGVARASSAGSKSGSIAHSLVLLTTLALVSTTARFGDQLGLDDEANSAIADGSDLGTCRPQVTSVGDLPTSSVSAVQLIPQ